ncbi:MAG: murein biosynthesis integral membrane protein MurJ [Desulfobacteraceae bacterium]|nr:murein biosynthesis integral membrane protein MurJ [Desulfobacteraceae bacterium]MBC2754984.1 murein biosynthesis integral membrane protein MurJ [Desulfobacteraceae bacterium]
MPASKSLYQKIGIASLIMMASVFLSRVIGLFREMVIAYAGGAEASVDAYQIAFVLPEILNHIVASGFLSVVFIPIFSRYLAEDREADGWKVFSVILTGFGSLLLLLILLAEWFAPELVGIVAPGIKNPAVKADAIHMTRIILPAQFFFFTGGMLSAVQFAKEKFAIPALAPLIYNLGIIVGGIILHHRFGMAGFSWGVLAGSFIGNFAIQIWGARRVGMTFFILFDFKHPDLRKYILLTLPLMLGLTMTFSTEFFLKFFGSFLPEGSIAALNYSLRVMLMLVGFFGQAVGVASFPFMARMAAENKLAEMNQLLNNTLQYLALVIPFSVLFMVLRHEMILILFQRGQFDETATALTSDVLVFMMVGAFAFAAQTVVVRGFFAVQNTLFPAIYGTIAVILSLPLYYFGMQKMGVQGVALAVSLAAIVQVLMLYSIWNKKSRNNGYPRVWKFYIKIIFLSAAMGVCLEWFRKTALSGINEMTLPGSFLVCLIIGTLFIVLFITAGQILGISEISDLLHRIRNKLFKKKRPAN